jgi:hypothetical protein
LKIRTSHRLIDGLLLRALHAAFERRTEAAIVVTACVGAWIFGSRYVEFSTLDWWYERVQLARQGGVLPNPDYELGALPWQTAHPKRFDVHGGRMTLVTNDEPFAYQAFAIVETHGAKAADFQFDIDIKTGGLTIGLLQAGKWIVSNSSSLPGRFADTNSTLLGYRRSITLMIANNNPAGETRLTVNALRLYLRR